MKRILLSVIALITTLSLSAQSSVSRRLSTDTFENRLVAEYETHNYQGMDCCRNYVISLQRELKCKESIVTQHPGKQICIRGVRLHEQLLVSGFE